MAAYGLQRHAVTNSVALFAYPSLTALVRNAFLMRRVDRLILFRHDDQRHPRFLDSIFCRLAQTITGRSVEVRSMHLFTQTSDAIDAVEMIHGNPAMGSELLDWMIDAAGCERSLATRYVRRVLLERTFASIALERAAFNEFNSCKDIWVFDPGSRPHTHNIKQIKEIDPLTTVFAWISFPILSYTRLCKAFLSSAFSFTVPAGKTYLLAVYEVAFQPIANHPEEKNASTKLHKNSNSSLAYSIGKEQTCQFMNDIWRPSQDIIDHYKAYLTENGYNYFDWAESRVSLGRLISLHRFWLVAMFHCLKHLRSFEYVFDAARMMGLYAREQIIFDNVNTSAFLAMDDYSERAIIRTHVARQRQKKTFLLQHSANDGIRSGPQITTVEADYYLTLSPFARESFKAYWQKENVIAYGYPRLDAILPVIHSRTEANSPFKNRKNSNKPVVVFALPDIRSHEQFLTALPSAKEFLKFLEIAKDRYKESLNILLRPKRDTGWEQTIEAVGFPADNILLDRDLITAEYLYFADMVYCSVGSGIMSECALLNTPFALFDFMNSPTDIYDHLGDGFFNATAENLIHQLDLLAAGKVMEINHAKTQGLFSDPYLPNRTKMISDLIFDDTTKASHPPHTSTEPLKQAT